MRFNKNLLKVNEYSLDGEVSGSDFVIGEDADKSFETINFTLNQLSIEVWGIGEAGQVLTATGDGRYVWTDDASESDIPSTTTSTTAAPTTTTTTAATTTTTTSYSDPTTTTTTAAATTSTTTASSQIIATTTTTTAFVNPIQSVCYKDERFYDRKEFNAGSSSYSAIHNGVEEFFVKLNLDEFIKTGKHSYWEFSVGDKFLHKGTCYTVACSYTSIPQLGGKNLTRILADGTYVFDSGSLRYIDGPCVDSDPDNITTTTTTTQAPTTTTTTPSPTTTTTTLSDFTFPPLCNYAIWDSIYLNGCLNQIVATYFDDFNTYLLRLHNSSCRQLSSEVYSFSSTPETIVVNFYNVNGSKIGVDYYYETKELGMPASQGEISAKSNTLGVHSSYFILSELDIFGNDPIADIGYSNGSQPNNLNNISITFKHANSGGSNECDVVVPTTTTTTTAPTTTTTTIAPTTTTTTSSVPSFSITNVNLSSLYYYSSNTDPSLYLSWSSATITTSGISSWDDLPGNGCNNSNSTVKEFHATFNVGGVDYGPYVARYSTAHSSVGNISSFFLSTFITGQSSSSNPNTLTEIQFSDNLWGTRCSSLTDLSSIFSNFTTSDTFTLEYIPLT